MGKRKKNADNTIFNTKTGKLKHSHLATDEHEQNLDKVWFEADIKPLLENKAAMEYIYNMLDIRQLMMLPDHKVLDKDFLDALKIKSIYLRSRFAQKKIPRWLKEKYSVDNNKAREAQDNLKGIGESLAFKGHNRLRIETVIALERDKVSKAIKDLRISEKRSEGIKRIELRKIFEDWLIDVTGR